MFGGLWAKAIAALAALAAILIAAATIVSRLMNAGAARQRATQLDAEVRGTETRRKVEDEVREASDDDVDAALRPGRRGMRDD